ncbi:UPF0489 family protein [Candidatus Gracilibacteria bacterium]|nr:UPF0489 family protein [Candidatus Gracilibacteria bacterium]
MYLTPRIISTPISNNRLNFDERGNRTIVVPSLIEGTLDDVATGEETVIEGEVSGKIIAGKGLKHFIFLKDSRVPTWIMDNHNHAFAFWHDALWKGWIQKGSLLVHVDQHTDLATPGNFPAWKHPEESHEGIVEEYVNTDLTIADFIVPALATGIIAETLMVTGEEKTGVGLFSWKDELKKKTSETILEHLTDYPSIILDIDLDYFSQGFDNAKTLETTKYWIERADIITIATSPLFIEQEKALTVLKSLQSSLVAL